MRFKEARLAGQRQPVHADRRFRPADGRDRADLRLGRHLRAGRPLAQSLKTADLRVVGVGSTINGAPINGQAHFGDSGGPMVYNGLQIGTCTGPVGGGTDPSRLTVAYQSVPQRAAWIRQTSGIGPGDGGNPNPPPPPPGPQPPPPPPGPGAGAGQPYTSYAVGARVTYGGGAYRAVQAHTSLPGWEPPNVPALWQPS